VIRTAGNESRGGHYGARTSKTRVTKSPGGRGRKEPGSKIGRGTRFFPRRGKGNRSLHLLSAKNPQWGRSQKTALPRDKNPPKGKTTVKQTQDARGEHHRAPTRQHGSKTRSGRFLNPAFRGLKKKMRNAEKSRASTD